MNGGHGFWNKGAAALRSAILATVDHACHEEPSEAAPTGRWWLTGTADKRLRECWHAGGPTALRQAARVRRAHAGIDLGMDLCRHHSAPATSAVSPTRPRGVRPSTTASNSGSCSSRVLAAGVAVYQGATALTRMPSFAHSQARFFVSWLREAAGHRRVSRGSEVDVM